MACLNLATCWHASQAQDASKTFQDVHKTPTRRAKRPPRHPKTHPGRTQNAPRTLPGRSKMPQDAPKTPDEAIRTLQDTSKMLQDLPKTPQGASRPRFWCRGTWIFEACWHPRPHPGLPEAPCWLVLRSLADGVSDHIRKSSFQFAPPYPPSSGADLHDDYAKIDAPDIHSSSVSA